MTIEEQIMKLQTYKMYEGEDTVYVERDDVLKLLEQQLRDCKTCIHSDKGNCAYTEECHECMWESNYEQMPRWIPVSERLPKDGQKVLVTTRSDNILDADLDTSIFYHASAFWKHYVIAWMPLPQPYKVESKIEQPLAYADQDTMMPAT